MNAGMSLPERLRAPHPDVAPLPHAVPFETGTRVLRGVPYALRDGTRPLELDLWLPRNTGSRAAPLVLFVHGGAWMRGRRDDLGFRFREWSPGPQARIAAEGFAVACVDYRLSGEAAFPAPLDDLGSALRWLATRSAELGVDSGRTVVWGESAGAHLAALLALTHTGPPLAGAVVWYGPSDLTTPRGGYGPDNPATPEALLLGGAPAALPEQASAASPLSRVHSGAPPFLIAHGEEDTMVSCSHSRDLAAALDTAGAHVDLRLIPGADHGWAGLPADQVEDIFTTSLGFARGLVS
ncbi:alpha/beta hydrolase [Streptomyces sp. NPDC006649]|uniref:alpha/beta hydrolase n=1 Tax=unclassified Streptomyces TaxID=2593676 RepID=UPI0032566FEE